MSEEKLAVPWKLLLCNNGRYWHYPESPGRRPSGSYCKGKRTLGNPRQFGAPQGAQQGRSLPFGNWRRPSLLGQETRSLPSGQNVSVEYHWLVNSIACRRCWHPSPGPTVVPRGRSPLTAGPSPGQGPRVPRGRTTGHWGWEAGREIPVTTRVSPEESLQLAGTLLGGWWCSQRAWTLRAEA
jgi:hypothetical protein